MTTTPAYDDPDVAGVTDTTPAAGDLVTFTSLTPWGPQTLVGRVVAVGTPDGAAGPQCQVEWITPTGPIDATTLEPYVPQV